MNDTQRIRDMSVDELREQVAIILRSNQRNEDLLDSFAQFAPWAKWIFITAVTGAVGIAVWVTTIEYRQQNFTEGHKDHHTQLKEITNWQIKTEANRFTSRDASEMMNSLMTAVATQDKRLQRVEDSSTHIKETLYKIEQKMQ